MRRLSLLLGICVWLMNAALACAQPIAKVRFVRDVEPVLAKSGCNAGACHGSFQGRGGLRLSLFGFDPRADYDALVKQLRGRRVFPGAPAQSMLLRKPSLDVPHGGGRRIAHDDEAYRTLHDWIAQGLAAPEPEADLVRRLIVEPQEATLPVGAEVALTVQAEFSDGELRDVTRWAQFESRNPNSASVSVMGMVKALSPGQTAITARYLGALVPISVVTPFQTLDAFPELPRFNYIDALVEAPWRGVGLLPAELCSDEEFLRRVYLDLIGTLPTAQEAREFLASTDEAKRSRRIDDLLARPEYVEYWTLKWSDLLRAHRRSLGDKGLGSFLGWLRQALRENRPVDAMVRELLVARGNLYQHGPVAFFFIDKGPEELAETTAQVFMGVRLQCAHCHHHPFEVWSQEDYYGLAAFFAGMERKDTREGGTYGGSQSVRFTPGGVLSHPGTGAPIRPRALGAAPSEAPLEADSRQLLADWLCTAQNPFFARNLVNRYWGALLGRGLVEPVDDLRGSNPASHPELLEALTRDFVDHGFDARHMLRTIANSRVYQLASRTSPRVDVENRFFSYHRVRRLPAEVLLDAINQVCGTHETFAGLPPGTRAISLPDPSVESYFLEVFGRPKRTTTCECERGGQPDLVQALHLINSERISSKLSAAEGRVALGLKAGRSNDDLLDELYLAALARYPSESERRTCAEFLAPIDMHDPSSRGAVFEDLLWTLLNCAEFSCNH